MSKTVFPFSLLPTAIGSMPHGDPQEAVAAVLAACPELPAWPQLYHRSPLEHMAPQFAGGLAGATLEGDRVVLEGPVNSAGPNTMKGREEIASCRSLSLSKGQADRGRLWRAAEPSTSSGNAAHVKNSQPLSLEHAAGFHALLKSDLRQARGLKGQITGPLTFASFTILKETRRPALEDPALALLLAEHLGRVAAWQEAQLRQYSKHTLMFLDEPLLGTALISPDVGYQRARDLLATTSARLQGLRGLHCCATPPWDFLFDLPIDVVSFDAYRYSHTMEAAASALCAFLARGGAIAWGIVPTEGATLEDETAESLAHGLTALWERLSQCGVPRVRLERQALITPACGLAHLTLPEAGKALRMTRAVANLLQRRAFDFPNQAVAPAARGLL